MKIYDKIIIAAMAIFVLISAGLALRPNKALEDKMLLRVSIDGNVVKEVSIDQNTTEDYRIETHDGYNIVSVNKGNISITEADCPGQYCVKKGWVTGANDIIVCLPHKLVVELVGIDNDEVDFISQ